MEQRIRDKVLDANCNFTKEYSFLQEADKFNEIALLGLGGSYAYGTNVETSDLDVRGIAPRTKEDILLGNDFEQVINEQTDTTIYSLDKAFRLLAQCNPNMIEILGLRNEDLFFITSEIGNTLYINKKLFLSKRCINTFGGYATQQLYRIQQKSLSVVSEREYKEHIKKVLEGMSDHLEKRYGISIDQIRPVVEEDNSLILDINAKVDANDLSGILGELNQTISDYYKPSKRNKKAFEHGKVGKHSMHLIRLYMMVIDILLNQEIITYREEEHDLLMSIRNGEFLDSTGKPSKEFFDLVKEYEEKFNEAKKKTCLPDEPDMEKIDNLRRRINESIVSGKRLTDIDM